MKHRKWILLFVIAALLLSGCSVGAGDAERTAPGRLDWPTDGLAALLPVPNGTRGEIAQNDADGLLVYVEDVSEAEFSNYANACWKQGFSVQYRLTDDSFEADKISGEHLSLSLNQETLCIALRAAAEQTKALPVPAQTEAETSAESEAIPVSTAAPETETEAPAETTAETQPPETETPATEAESAPVETESATAASESSPAETETDAPRSLDQSEPEQTDDPNARDYVLNKNTMKFHKPSCSSVGDIKPENRWDFHGTREEVLDMGYVPCKRCNP